jgi:PKD repeat protein
MRKHLLFCLLFCGLFISSQAQWIPQASGFATTSRGIRDISAVDSNIVWAIAYDGVTATNQIQEFTRTINGGNLWTAGVITGYTGWGLAMISAVDGQNAWIPAWNPAGGGSILHTSDGGATWTPQSTAVFESPAGFPNVVHFWDVNNGFCMGDPNGGYFEIYTTTNGGTTWTRVPQADIPANLASEWGTTGFYSVVGDIVWFTTGKGRVYKSIDKGYHWTVAATPVTADQLRIEFRDALHGIVQSNATPFPTYYTVDGGSTWNTLTTMGNFYTNDFCYIPGTAQTYLSVGADITNSLSGVSYSTDDGGIWDNFIGSDTGQFLAVDFVDANHGWAGAFNTDAVTGGMWKYDGTDFVVDPCAGFAASFAASSYIVDLNTSGLVNFTDLSSGTPTGWAWDFGDGGTATTQTASHTYTTTGHFAVSLDITKTSCATNFVDSIEVINTAGIEKNNGNAQMEIWPNPASDYLNLSSVPLITEVDLFNGLGQNVFSQKVMENQLRIDLNQLTEGVYYIRVLTQSGSAEGRFLIRR